MLVRFGYDDLGRRTSLVRSNGRSSVYEYDPASRLSALLHTSYGSSQDVRFDYAYNPASQIATRTSSNDLFSGNAPPAGFSPYAANGRNQLTQIASATPTHDPRGNMTFDGSRQYQYSSENLLTGASAPGDTPITIGLAYDPLMRLYQVEGTTDRRFVYDGMEMIAEYDGSGNVLRRFVHGPGIDEPLVCYEGTGTSDRRFLHQDERGSVVAQSNFFGSGDIVAFNRYDPDGVPDANNSGRFQYTGQVWLPEVELYYYRTRMYHPHLPRFMQTDPIGYASGPNLYPYAGGDPVNFTDPTGTTACTGSRIASACSRMDGGQGGIARGYSGWSTGEWRGDFRNDAHLRGFLYHYEEGRYVGGSRHGQLAYRILTGVSGMYSGQLGDVSLFAGAGGQLGQCRSESCPQGVMTPRFPPSPTLRALLRDVDVNRAMWAAWRLSNPNGRTRDKNEHGFWIFRRGNDYFIHRMIRGEGASIEGIRNRPAGAYIFFHTHPFTAAERYAQGWSGIDMGVANRNPGYFWILLGHTGLLEFDDTMRRR